MNKKTITRGILGAITAISPIALVVSCGKSESAAFNLTVKNNFADQWAKTNKSLYFDAILTHWTDGDTASFKPVDQHGLDIAQGRTSLRIQNIDSPEVSHPGHDTADVSPVEEMWGNKSKDFAKNLIPEVHIHGDNIPATAKRIRIWTTGAFSYNRIVGSIFYGEHFEHNYAIEQLHAGLSLPMIDVQSIYNENNVNSFLIEEASNAFNNAYVNKRGLFTMTQAELEEALKAHGVRPWGNLLYSNRNKAENVYDLISIVKETT